MLEDNTVYRSDTDAMQTYLNWFIYYLAERDREDREARIAIYRMLESSVGGSASNSIDRTQTCWWGFTSLWTSESEGLGQAYDGMQFLKDVGYDFNAVSDPDGTRIST